MRLLQLATGENELIDLHPNVTVVAGLDQAGRRLLKDAVTGLARGAATGQRGLLEAHGVLFDLTPDMLDLLDIAPGDLQPIVTGDDLPIAHLDPRVRERAAAEREMADAEERWATRGEEHDRAAAAAAASAASPRTGTAAVDAAESDADQSDPVDRRTHVGARPRDRGRSAARRAARSGGAASDGGGEVAS